MSSIMAMSVLGPLCFKSVNNADEGHIYVMHVDVLAYMSLKYRKCVNADNLLIICRACQCFGSGVFRSVIEHCDEMSCMSIY